MRASPSGRSTRGSLYQTLTDTRDITRLPVLPVGRYELDVQAPGFRSYQATTLCSTPTRRSRSTRCLKSAVLTQTVSVTDNALHVETVSTQLGQVITGRQMAAVPLNGRSFTDLLSLQPGVAPSTTISSSTVQDVGATDLSIHRERSTPAQFPSTASGRLANYFSVNGSDAEEDVNAGTAIIPNLDAIAEFRIVTSNFDAEYGEFSGGQISVVTKSGSNGSTAAHSTFCAIPIWMRATTFRRRAGPIARTSLAEPWAARFDATRYSSSPTIRARGRRRASIRAKSACRRMRTARAISRRLRQLRAQTSLDRMVSGPYLAKLLTQKLGSTCRSGEPYYFPAAARCTPGSACLPNAVIPQRRGPFRRNGCSNIFRLRTLPTALPHPPTTRPCRTTKRARAWMRTPAGVCFGLLLHRRFQSR